MQLNDWNSYSLKTRYGPLGQCYIIDAIKLFLSIALLILNVCYISIDQIDCDFKYAVQMAFSYSQKPHSTLLETLGYCN